MIRREFIKAVRVAETFRAEISKRVVIFLSIRFDMRLEVVGVPSGWMVWIDDEGDVGEGGT